MKRSRFSEEQIIGILKEHQAGLGAKELYRETYYTTGKSQHSIWRVSHRLSRNDKVARRIADLVAAPQEEEHNQSRIRAYRVTKHLMEMMRSGKTESARLRAAELLGKTVGMFTIKAEVKKIDDDRSLAELEDKLEDELRRRMERLKAAR